MNIFNKIIDFTYINAFKETRGLQNIYTPIDKIEETTNFKFVSVINENTKNIGILFNFEFIDNILKNIDKNYINNISITFFYDSKFDLDQAKYIAKYKYNFNNIEYVSIEDFAKSKNIKDLEKAMANKHFDIVFSNPPYNDGLDLKIISSIKNIFKKAIIVHPATWILENKNLGKFKTFKNEWKNNIEFIVIFSGTNIFQVPFMCPLDICIFNTEKTDSNIIVEDKIINSNYNVNDINDITIYGDIWFKLNIKDLIKKCKTYKSILDMPIRQKHFNNEKYLKFPCKLPVLRSGNPHFNGGYYDEKLGYYVLDKDNFFFTCIAKGDPNKYHFVFEEKNSTLCYNFQTENERWNFYNYCKTKVFRFILSVRKVSGNIDRGELAWTPWLDFTQEWNDAKLCKEFGISKELWNYIDNFIPNLYDDYKSGF